VNADVGSAKDLRMLNYSEGFKTVFQPPLFCACCSSLIWQSDAIPEHERASLEVKNLN
jgi:hypothetical protein